MRQFVVQNKFCSGIRFSENFQRKFLQKFPKGIITYEINEIKIQKPTDIKRRMIILQDNMKLCKGLHM